MSRGGIGVGPDHFYTRRFPVPPLRLLYSRHRQPKHVRDCVLTTKGIPSSVGHRITKRTWARNQRPPCSEASLEAATATAFTMGPDGPEQRKHERAALLRYARAITHAHDEHDTTSVSESMQDRHRRRVGGGRRRTEEEGAGSERGNVTADRCGARDGMEAEEHASTSGNTF